MTSENNSDVELSGDARVSSGSFPHALPALLFFVCFAIQFWYATAGTMRYLVTDDFYTTYHYQYLADAFLNGQLHFLFDPPATLLRESDPYDPGVWHTRGGLYEATLFNGHYYLYYGPTPAVALALAKALIRFEDLPDSALTIGFLALLTAAGSALIWRIWRAAYQGTSVWLPVFGVLVLALGTPSLFIVGRPAFYEAAIVSGQALLACGLLFLLIGRDRAGGGRRLLVLAGACLALALGCRLTLAGPVIALVATHWLRELVAYVRDRSAAATGPSATGAGLTGALALTVPVVFGVVVLGLYNEARFGSWAETGLRYVLTGDNFFKQYDSVFGLRFVGPNVYNLFLRPFDLLPAFPFISWSSLENASIPRWAIPVPLSPTEGPLPPGAWPALSLHMEPITGIFLASPFLFFAFASQQAWRGPSRIRWLKATLAAVVVAATIPLLLFHVATMRYLLEISTLLTLLATIGLFELSLVATRLRWLVSLSAATLAAFSVMSSSLFGVSGYFDHFLAHNPDLYASIAVRRLSVEQASRIPQNALASFGDTAELVGYRFQTHQAKAGDVVWLTLWWRSLRPSPLEDLHVNLRFVTESFDLIDEEDSPPFRGSYTFDRWQPGEILEEQRRLRIPFDVEDDVRAPTDLFVEIVVHHQSDRSKTLAVRDPRGGLAGQLFRAGPIPLTSSGRR